MNNSARIALENDPLLKQATEWALEMWDADVPVERVAQWQRWLSADDRHRAAFARVEEVMDIAGRARAIPWPDQAALTSDDYDGSVAVSAWKTRSLKAASVQGRHRLWFPAVLAATMLLVIAALLAGYPRSLTIPNVMSYKRMETPVGGTLKVMLADGSGVDIGSRSTLRALMTSQSRTLTLEQGEAFFRVAKDGSRPFRVNVGAASITAIGTEFNVRRTGEHIVVSVAEGTVRVDAAKAGAATATRQLGAGQQLSIEPKGAELTVASVDTRTVASWREGRLRYLNEPLASVVEDVIRHTNRDIELGEPALGHLRVTGTVLEHNLDGWLTSLEETFPVRVQRKPDGSVRLEPAH